MKFMEISNGLSIYEHYKLDAEEENTPQKYFFIFNEKDLLLIDNEVPLLNSLMDIGIEEEDIKNNIFMGQFHDKDTYVISLDLDEESKSKFIESNEGFEFVFLAKVFDINEEIYLLGGRATQIIDWDNNHKYCGKCGAETIYSETEKGAKLCPECGFTSFTRISPAIITSIIKEEVNQEGKVENKLLMARHSYYENIRYSLIAGFMDCSFSIFFRIATASGSFVLYLLIKQPPIFHDDSKRKFFPLLHHDYSTAGGKSQSERIRRPAKPAVQTKKQTFPQLPDCLFLSV